MAKRPRGRPKGSLGRAASLSADQIKRAFKVARSERYADRAELLLSLSIELGMRATELASLRVVDVFNLDGSVRPVISSQRAFLPGEMSQVDITHYPGVKRLLTEFYEKHRHRLMFDDQRSLFASQRGSMTAASIARYLTALYRKAGFRTATSRSGRRTNLIRSSQP